jgi:hypothetical protein
VDVAGCAVLVLPNSPPPVDAAGCAVELPNSPPPVDVAGWAVELPNSPPAEAGCAVVAPPNRPPVAAGCVDGFAVLFPNENGEPGAAGCAGFPKSPDMFAVCCAEASPAAVEGPNF